MPRVGGDAYWAEAQGTRTNSAQAITKYKLAIVVSAASVGRQSGVVAFCLSLFGVFTCVCNLQ